MILNLTELSSEPLHTQISRQIRAQILAGSLPHGTSLPSIRALARESRVSVITVQRAYEDLEREGLIAAHRGKGFFVRALSLELRQTTARERLSERLREVVKAGMAEGVSIEEIRKQLESILFDSSNLKKSDK